MGFDFDDAISLVHMKNKLYEIPGITMVELEPFIMACKVPNDPYYAYDSEGNELWALQSIGVEKVWDFCEGSKAVKVGILDLGVYDHVDLQENLGVGLDCANKDTITNDTSSDHGTIIAGIIGGVGNNGLGISGVNWRVTIVPLQVQGSTGSYNIDAIETALDYATDSYKTSTPISVLNLSFGMAKDMYTFADTVDSLQNYPGLIVCCAGNSGADNDRHHFYPGYYGSELYENPIENIIVVGGLDPYGDKAYCSNYGEKRLIFTLLE